MAEIEQLDVDKIKPSPFQPRDEFDDKSIEEYLKKGIEPDNLELLSVEIKEEKFMIEGIPWSKIASKLVKETIS